MASCASSDSAEVGVKRRVWDDGRVEKRTTNNKTLCHGKETLTPCAGTHTHPHTNKQQQRNLEAATTRETSAQVVYNPTHGGGEPVSPKI